jgi:lysozyme
MQNWIGWLMDLMKSLLSQIIKRVDAAAVAKASTYRTNMNIGTKGLDLIRFFEGLELNAYQCAAGVWTIGYGHTKDVQQGMTISEARANEMLAEELNEYESYINGLVTVELNQDQFDAMVSWVYNLGVGNLKASTLLKVLNAGDYDGVPAQMMRWNKAGGKVLEGLTKRRQAEADLFCGN